VDHLAIGAALRTARIRRRWRQVDVAHRVNSSQPFVSKLERGQLHRVRLGDLERVAGVLEVRLELRAWWRGAELDRLRAGHHSAMHEIVTALLLELGWEVASEVSFNIYGERGVIDILAWQKTTRTLLIVGGDWPERSRVTETGSQKRSQLGSCWPRAARIADGWPSTAPSSARRFRRTAARLPAGCAGPPRHWLRFPS
jgi:transcriptional regulator with XRE-family HTH domain